MATWYCDVTINNQYVTLHRDSHLDWNGTTVPLPPFAAGFQNLLFVRLHPLGTRFAGVGHADDYLWEYDGTAWIKHPSKCWGPQSVIYDRGGMLHVNSTDPSGFRYVDTNNHIWTCDETRADIDAGVWDFSDHGDLCIGQGGDGLGEGDDPIIALYQGRRILLQPGRCRFINSYREGDLVAYACHRQDTSESLTRWLTISEIIASPDIGEPPPPGSHPPPVATAEALREVPDEKLGKQPGFADLKTTLAQSKQIENPLYQTIQEMIERLMQFQKITVARIEQVNAKTEGIKQNFAYNYASYHTRADETPILPNSVQLLAGEGIEFDDSLANRRVIHSIASGTSTYYDAPLTDGNTVETDLIFANGECIIVQVPNT